MKSRWLTVALLTFGGLLAAVGIGSVLFMLFVFSIGTAGVALQVETSVLDKATQAPVPNCLLTFDNGSGYPRAPVRSGAQGQGSHTTGYSFGGSIFTMPFQRQRTPGLTFFVGEPIDGAEKWQVDLRFQKPWLSKEAVAQIQLQRNQALQPADELVRASVRFETGAAGGERDHVLMTIFLDQDQIAACQAPSQNEAAKLFNDKRYPEALAAYRAAASGPKPPAWAFVGIGDCLGHLSPGKEEVAAYEKALELDPSDTETLFWYARALTGVDDKKSVEVYRKVIAREPKKPRGLVGLSYALYNLHRTRESLEANRQAVELAPDDVNVLYEYANALVGQRDQEAIERFKKLIPRDTKPARSYIGMAIALSNLERYRECVQAYATARQLCASCLSAKDVGIEADAKRELSAR